MELTSKDVSDLAQLARLGLGQDEIEKYRHDLVSILGYVDKLSEATTKEAPVANMSGLDTVLREDTIFNSLGREEALKNAPMQEKGFIKVQSVFNHDN